MQQPLDRCYNVAMDELLKIGNRIMALREADGLTQAQLAERVGVSQATVSQWESGTRTPSGEAVVALARVFDTSADFLLGLVDEQIRLVPYFRDLSEDEQLLLQAFSQLTARQKRAVEHLLAALADDGKKG